MKISLVKISAYLLLGLLVFTLPVPGQTVLADPSIEIIWPDSQVIYWGFPLDVDTYSSPASPGNELRYQWDLCLDDPTCAVPDYTLPSTNGNLHIPFNSAWPKGPTVYTLRLTVTEYEDENPVGTATATIQAIVAQHSPLICDAYPEQLSLYRGESFIYDSSTLDVDGTTTYKWYLDDDQQLSTAASYGLDIDDLNLEPNQEHTVKFLATDDQAAVCYDTTKLVVENQRPTVEMTGEMRVYNDHGNITYRATRNDPESDALTADDWYRDGGTLPISTEENYTMSDLAGLTCTDHTVKTGATDEYGARTELTANLKILNPPPRNVAIYPAYAEVYLGEAVSLTPAEAIDDDCQNSTINYAWYSVPNNEGVLEEDGVLLEGGVEVTNKIHGPSPYAAASFAYTPPNLGENLVKLVVIDGDSPASRTIAYTKILVKNHSPRVNLGADRAVPDADLALTATVSDEEVSAGLQTLEYNWTLNTIPATTPIALTHDLSNPARVAISADELEGGKDYKVTLTVDDGSGMENEPASSSDSLTIYVKNATPEASITAENPISLMGKASLIPLGPEKFELNGTALDPDQSNNLLSYVWSLHSATTTAETEVCSGYLAPGVELPSCPDLSAAPAGQYYAELRLDDNSNFPFKPTTVDRIALITGNVDSNVLWMEKGSVIVDTASPTLIDSDLSGYAKNNTNHYINGNQSPVESAGEFSDNFAVKYVTLKLTNKDMVAVPDVYEFEFELSELGVPTLVGQQVPTEPKLTFVSVVADTDSTPVAPKLKITLQSNLEKAAARYTVSYKIEDATAYHPAAGNLSDPLWQDTPITLVIDAIAPQISFVNCPESAWSNEVQAFNLKGNLKDRLTGYSEDWVSAGLPETFDNTKSQLEFDTLIPPASELLNVALSSSGEWNFIHDYQEEHPKLTLEIADMVGNRGSGICTANFDTTAPTLLGSNPEEDGVMLDPEADLEVFLQETHNSIIPLSEEPLLHGILESSIVQDLNLNLYKTDGGSCVPTRIASFDYQSLSHPQHLIRIHPEKPLDSDSGYRLVVNAELSSACLERAIETSDMIRDLAGNTLDATQIDFTTARGSGFLSITKEAFAADGSAIDYIIPSRDTVPKFIITLRAPEDNLIELSQGWQITDLLPPYLESNSSSPASFTIYDAQGRSQGSTPITPTVVPDYDARLGQKLVWKLPETIRPAEIPAGGSIEIEYSVKLNNLFIPPSV